MDAEVIMYCFLGELPLLVALSAPEMMATFCRAMSTKSRLSSKSVKGGLGDVENPRTRNSELEIS